MTVKCRIVTLRKEGYNNKGKGLGNYTV